MLKYCNIILILVISIAVVHCASGPKPGTRGRGSAAVIEKGDHPDFPDGVSCYVCHKDEIPQHEFHSKFGRNCDQCHVKTTWMAEKYPHTEWPLDDIHKVRCTRCHTQAAAFNFKQYQCYGCHHEEEPIKTVHKNMDAAKLARCADCHKGFGNTTN